MNKNRIGSDFDDYLREEGDLEAVEAAAIKRVIALQIAQEMARSEVTKSAMALRMKTSRAALDRLLDPENPSVTLDTLARAAAALGKRMRLTLEAPVQPSGKARRVVVRKNKLAPAHGSTPDFSGSDGI